jgi:hypothetical protein
MLASASKNRLGEADSLSLSTFQSFAVCGVTRRRDGEDIDETGGFLQAAENFLERDFLRAEQVAEELVMALLCNRARL